MNARTTPRPTPRPNVPALSNKVDPEVTDKNLYGSVNNNYKLVQWRHLPNDVKHRFYEETVFRHQPGAQYNSVTRTRKYGVHETNLASQYSSNHLSGIFALHNLERLKGK